jgi:hypothetical protein
MPEVKEMAHRLVATRVIVDEDRGGIVAEPALHFDRSNARVECQPHIVRPEGRRKDDPVHTPGQEPLDAFALALGVTVGVREENVKALFGRRLLGPHCDLGIERVRQTSMDNDPEGDRAPTPQVLGNGIEPIAALSERYLNAPTHLRRGVPVVMKDT